MFTVYAITFNRLCPNVQLFGVDNISDLYCLISAKLDNANASKIPFNTLSCAYYFSGAEEVMLPGRKDYRVSMTSTGSLSYNFPTVAKSICRVNVRFFPFDTQQCSLTFGSWSHHGNELSIINRNPQGQYSFELC